jgi:hypothetical protein
MKSEFDLLISFRTPKGFQVCGQYLLGSDQAFAENLFDSLTGRQDKSDDAILHLDLMEKSGELPVRIRTIGCKLSELCANCERVTRELFRLHALDPD